MTLYIGVLAAADCSEFGGFVLIAFLEGDAEVILEGLYL